MLFRSLDDSLFQIVQMGAAHTGVDVPAVGADAEEGALCAQTGEQLPGHLGRRAVGAVDTDVQARQVVSHKGIDVSKHQGNIDWTKVAADGVEFAFIRVGLRGYGTEGKLVEDEYFEQNIKGALQAGIKVGVYFYSQAITDAELLEEANLVLEKVKPYNIELPIVFDVEKVSGGKGRANELSVEERTRLTALFCQTVQDAGYKPDRKSVV